MLRALAASLVVSMVSCGGGGSGGSSSTPTFPIELSFPGVGPKGIFDPSLARDSATGRLWMAYSEVSDSAMWPGQNDNIRTRMAWSDDAGASWTDAGVVINPSQDVALPLPPPFNAGTWNNEVPAIVEDPGAPAGDRWKLLWHHYLWVNGARVFQHGWIAMKTAPAPSGPWSAERKLFVGSLYDPVNDATIGPPEVRVDALHADLAATLVCSEPGLLATPDALYVIMLCAEGLSTNGRIALLKLPHASPGWQYRGSPLVNAVDGPPFGCHGFSAPELFVQGATVRLIVTPQMSDIYRGTTVFTVADLDAGTLLRSAGLPVAALEFTGTAGSHNGAAGYAAQATACGILYSEALLTPPLHFRIYKSGRNP